MSEKQSKALAPVDEVKGSLSKMSDQFKLALPPHIPVERFVRVLQTAVSTSPDLIAADRTSLFAAAMKAAQEGLMPDGREAAIVVYNTNIGDKANPKWIKKAQFMSMVYGVLKKVRNSGELASISPHVVYENDFFDYWIDETGEHLKHKPKLSGSRGEITHSYCVARMKDGATYIEVMSKEEVDKIRSMSKAKNGPAWEEWYGEMAKKSATRRLSKRLPMSTDLETTIHADDDLFMPPKENETEPQEKKTKSSRLAQAVGVSNVEQTERSVSETPQVSETTTESAAREQEVPI